MAEYIERWEKPGELFARIVQTTVNGTPTDIEVLATDELEELSSDTAFLYIVDVNVYGTNGALTKTGSFRLQTIFEIDGAVAAIVGRKTFTFNQSDDGDIAIDLSASGADITLKVTGLASYTMYWLADRRIIRIQKEEDVE